MSTRSGKRIHSSFHETTLIPEIEHVAQSERKTRSRRFKDNVEESSVSVLKNKKRSNYVSYPTEDELGTDLVDTKEEDVEPARPLLKNALKEQNLIASSTESADGPNDVFKPVRMTRRTRKFVEDTIDAQENLNCAKEVIKHEGNTKTEKKKKEKKKKKSITEETVEVVSKKKSKKKLKKPKTSGTMVVEDIVPENAERDTLNKSNMSVESFLSAAGSPLKNIASDVISPVKDFKVDATDKPERRQTRSIARISCVSIPQHSVDRVVKPSLKRKSSIKDLDTIFGNETGKNSQPEEYDTTLTNIPKKRKCSIRDTVSKKNADTTFDKDIKDSTYDLEDLKERKSISQTVVNTTYDKSDTPKSTGTNTVLDKSEDILDQNTNYDNKIMFTSKTQTPQPKFNSMLEKSNHKSSVELITNCVKEKPAVNTTFEKDPINESVTRKSAIINTTSEKNFDNDIKEDSIVRKSILLNDTNDKNDVSSYILSETEDSNTYLRKSLQQTQKLSTEMNSTYDKTEKSDSDEKNATWNTDKKLDRTFDKNSKSSIISSDCSNITLDKSDVSRISITSDDSKDNIVNTTPVLIESSMDESQTNMSRLCSKNDDQLKTPTRTSEISLKAPITPLIREGTFTKDDTDVNGTELDLLKTPTRKMSLPAAGYTPFTNKSGSKEKSESDKSMMNITRSLEKSRRSSLAEPLPRATRVMFCSPVNNPVVAAQQRRKVIKSNLKGSNKSFVFEDAAPVGRAAPRKRSYTHSDADDERARRGRPRTASATAKLTDPGTPSKKTTVTPHKSESKISRTKLPNFAALHQREFSKMESLDECQERRARRARLLLTPTGGVAVLERASTSPTESIETKPDEAKKSVNQQNEDSKEQRSSKRPKHPKKPETPIKSLPTLKSLNPGYTRFGFKLNYDVNPFSVTNKNISQSFSGNNISQSLSTKKNTAKRDLTRPLKEIRGLKRQVTLPSLTGTTSAREAAKQTVMREKSFTDKRNKTRNENRTVIKGVRTNRRFELQMRMRNMD